MFNESVRVTSGIISGGFRCFLPICKIYFVWNVGLSVLIKKALHMMHVQSLFGFYNSNSFTRHPASPRSKGTVPVQCTCHLSSPKHRQAGIRCLRL